MSSTIRDILEDPEFAEGSAWSRHNFQANETIVQEGEIGTSLFFVENGVLRVTGNIALKKNRHIQPGIWELKAGDIFGETCLFEVNERTASVIGVDSGIVVEINGEKLRQYLNKHPEKGYFFLKEIFESLVERLKKANHRVEELFAWGLKAHDIEKDL